MMAPLRRRRGEVTGLALRARRALRIAARRMPSRLAETGTAWRLAPAAPAALLAAVLALGAAGPLAETADPAAAALPLPEDPHHPGTGLLQGLSLPNAR
jgi:hypothetical protein